MLMSFTVDVTRRRLKVQDTTGLPPQTRTGAFVRVPGSDEANVEEVQNCKAWLQDERGGQYFETEGSEDSRVYTLYFELQQRTYPGTPDCFTAVIVDTDLQMGDWMDFSDNGNFLTGLVIYVNATDHLEARVRVIGKEGEG